MKPYYSITEMWQNISKHKKNHPIKSFFEDIYYSFLRTLAKPKGFYYTVKYFFQRGKRGYSDRDVWNLDNYLSKVIKNSVRELRMTTISDNEEFKNILIEIEYLFKVNEEISNGKCVYLNSKKRNQKSVKICAKICDYHIMTKEECKRYRNAWKLFQTHFLNLWS
jgi:hypothetical protein